MSQQMEVSQPEDRATALLRAISFHQTVSSLLSIWFIISLSCILPLRDDNNQALNYIVIMLGCSRRQEFALCTHLPSLRVILVFYCGVFIFYFICIELIVPFCIELNHPFLKIHDKFLWFANMLPGVINLRRQVIYNFFFFFLVLLERWCPKFKCHLI